MVAFDLRAFDRIRFRGHPLIQADHRTTFELTRDRSVTLRGDCIIGVEADKACSDLSPSLKRILATDGSSVRITIQVGGLDFVVNARGDASLTLADERCIVVRRSSYTCPRTLAIHADRSARDLPREIVALLRDPDVWGVMLVEAYLT